MKKITEEIFNHIWNLPFVDGYTYNSLFFSKYPEEGVIRYGAFYGDQFEPKFFLVVENFKKVPDLSQNKSREISGKKIYSGYIPEFNIVKKWLKQQFNLISLATATWKDGNNILTIIDLGGGINLRDYIRALDSDKTISKTDLYPLFKNCKFLPESVGEWELVTMFFWFSRVTDEFATEHGIRHVQGNYRKGKDFLNIELRFGCQHPASISGLKIENLAKEVKIGDKKIKQGYINREFFMNYLDELKRYSITVHDNKQNQIKDEKIVEALMKEALKSMKSYYFEAIPQELLNTM